VSIVNIELNENMEVACPPSIPSSSALSALHVLAAAAASAFKSRAALQLENVALRHQLGVLRRSVKRPKLTPVDRCLWAWLSQVWNDWRSSLLIVQPETVIAWHRKSFRLFWTWRVQHGLPGRPPVPMEIRKLMSREWMYGTLGLFSEYRVSYLPSIPAVAPV
jgi:hypothetical protein